VKRRSCVIACSKASLVSVQNETKIRHEAVVYIVYKGVRVFAALTLGLATGRASGP